MFAQAAIAQSLAAQRYADTAMFEHLARLDRIEGISKDHYACRDKQWDEDLYSDSDYKERREAIYTEFQGVQKVCLIQTSEQLNPSASPVYADTLRRLQADVKADELSEGEEIVRASLLDQVRDFLIEDIR